MGWKQQKAYLLIAHYTRERVVIVWKTTVTFMLLWCAERVIHKDNGNVIRCLKQEEKKTKKKVKKWKKKLFKGQKHYFGLKKFRNCQTLNSNDTLTIRNVSLRLNGQTRTNPYIEPHGEYNYLPQQCLIICTSLKTVFDWESNPTV